MDIKETVLIIPLTMSKEQLNDLLLDAREKFGGILSGEQYEFVVRKVINNGQENTVLKLINVNYDILEYFQSKIYNL